MTPSVSDGIPVQPAQPPAAAQPTVNQAPPPPPEEDTIAFSEAAQVSLLNAQGMSALAIAEELGIPISVVDSDLELISTDGPSPPPESASAPAPVSTAQAEPSGSPTVQTEP